MCVDLKSARTIVGAIDALGRVAVGTSADGTSVRGWPGPVQQRAFCDERGAERTVEADERRQWTGSRGGPDTGRAMVAPEPTRCDRLELPEVADAAPAGLTKPVARAGW